MPRRFQFSLATLLLLSLTIAAIAGIVVRRQAWTPVLAIEDPVYGRPSPDGRFILTATDAAHSLGIWDLTALRRSGTLKAGADEFATIRAVSFFPDNRVATIDDLGLVQVWDTTGKQTQRFETELLGIDTLVARDRFIIAERLICSSLSLATGAVRDLGGRNAALSPRHVPGDGRYVIMDGVIAASASGKSMPLPGVPELNYVSPVRPELLLNDAGKLVYFVVGAGSPRCEIKGLNLDFGGMHPSGDFIYEPRDNRIVVWDCVTGEQRDLRSIPGKQWGSPRFASDRMRFIQMREIYDATNFDSSDDVLQFFGCDAHFVPLPDYGDRVASRDIAGMITVYDRRHPEWWWGHFYRPEVWLGVALLVAWILKIHRWRKSRATGATGSAASRA